MNPAEELAHADAVALVRIHHLEEMSEGDVVVA